MKNLMVILFGLLFIMSYVIYNQKKQIDILCEAVALTMPRVIENTQRLDEHTALIKQLTGTDYEQKEKALFRAFEPKPIEY